MRIVKKGLFGEKNVSSTVLATKFLKKENTHSYREIINSFDFTDSVKKLLFQFVIQLSYNMSAKVLRKQLALLQTLSLDDQLKILNKTLQHKWKSLVPAYELLMKSRCDNMQNQLTIISSNSPLDLVKETF